MPKAWVTITAFNGENYSKRIATLSEVQIHSADSRARDPSMSEIGEISKVGVVIEPSKFPEMNRFVVSVELLK